ncbi:nucleoside phosphorylase [Tamlana sp. 62-3]|uniref:Uridine phosphorylase n=1 Tax=Neotamlana sargassicola TaxID=2883125 RepID=A0A9X1I7X8_9FLAO|nr:nucleoside phosphorylase [Tamlana sargassicola]MCB4808439.1 nucleoside phosphorylase [Tamlana sargassicola]
MSIKESELILNPDGSVYHLNLKPEHVAKTIIFVGDPDRVEKVTCHFDSIEFTTHKREFKTQTGYYKNKRISVISTGIGSDNIDIVLNELDALFNIDLQTRQPKKELTSLNIIRVGTSGSLQKEIPVNSVLVSEYGLDINGTLQFYVTDNISHSNIEKAFINQTNWSKNKSNPLAIKSSEKLFKIFFNNNTYKGITVTANGFYGPQGRVLRLPIQDSDINSKLESFNFENLKITNLEMETSGIYGLSALLGHHAISLNAIIANRPSGTFSENPSKVIEDLILYALNTIVEQI